MLDDSYDEFPPYLGVGPLDVNDIVETLKYSTNPKAATMKPSDAFVNSLVQQI